MLKDFLPNEIYVALNKRCNESEINEIRIRVNKPITVICNTKTYFLSDEGITSNISQAFFGSSELLEDIVFKASNYSIYAVNEQIKKGYIIVEGGIRLGVCGEVVFDNGVKTIKKFTSVCIRIPHEIQNASLQIFNQVLNNGALNNTLIISPPGAGKTTMLRDLILQFSRHNYAYNIFIADERGEITGGNNSKLNLGNFCDSISFLNKNDAFTLGIRSMAPDIIATDELGGVEDFKAVSYAINCGVTIIATIHADGIEELKHKSEFKPFIENRYFKRYIVLSKASGVGTIEGVYAENLTRIYGGII